MHNESSPTNSGEKHESNEKNENPGIDSLEAMADKFDPDKAHKLQDEARSQAPSEESAKIESAPQIDYSCFDSLNDGGFANLPKEQRKEIIDKCEEAYDASVEEFAKMGDFRDPETDRYNGDDEYHEGLDGAIRGVNAIVRSPIDVEYYQEQVKELEKELAEHSGFRLFGRKKNEDAKREITNKLWQARFELKHAQEWPDHIGQLAFGSMEKWQSEEIQSKYKHMVQMRKDIKRAKQFDKV